MCKCMLASPHSYVAPGQTLSTHFQRLIFKPAVLLSLCGHDQHSAVQVLRVGRMHQRGKLRVLALLLCPRQHGTYAVESSPLLCVTRVSSVSPHVGTTFHPVLEPLVAPNPNVAGVSVLAAAG